jgi:1-acyl-sn-glycerol-3-phosphate acyltransferase
MRLVLRRLYYYYFYFVFGATILLLWPRILYLLAKPKRYPRAHLLRRRWARAVLWLTGMRREAQGLEKINWQETHIFIGNHFSNLDILLLTASLPAYFSFLGKEELESVPFLGRFFSTIDIMVDRSSHAKSALSYRKSLQALQEGRSLIIFPEGGIIGEAPRLHPFKDGPFDMAVRASVPVVPFSMPDNWRRLPDDRKEGKPGKIRIILHPPLPVEGLSKEDVPHLCRTAYQIVAEDLAKYANEN